MRRPIWPCLAAACWLLAAPSSATPGEVENAGDRLPGIGFATVVGTVRDGETGGPLADAVVRMAGVNRATTTDSCGRYVLSRIPAGAHDVTIRFVGYAPRTLHLFVPPAGELEISVSLLPEPIYLPTVKVQATVPVRGVEVGTGAESSDRGSTIGAIRNHPLLAEPDVLQGLGGGEVVLRPESPSGVHVCGAASDQTGYLLDGIPVYSPYHIGGLFTAWNPDALSRIDLLSSAPSPADPQFLSGAAAAVTRSPGRFLIAQGSVSTTHARLTVDGPLGIAGAGYLVSVRSGFPAGLAKRGEQSYVRGKTGDAMAKLEAPAFGGRLWILGYNSENDIRTAAGVHVDGPGGPTRPDQRRNLFEWYSKSLGTGWSRDFARATVRVLGWSAEGGANSTWAAERSPLDMTAMRRDVGLMAVLERDRPGRKTSLGLRVERIRTSYRTEPDSAYAPFGLSARMVIAAPFVQHTQAIGDDIELQLGSSLASASGRLHLGPRAQVRWRMSNVLTLTGTYARAHQFAQSLRNSESVVGNVFPVDLYMGAGASGIPVARSDQGVFSAEYHPRPGVRLGAQAYVRGLHHLVLVAPVDGEPFSTGAFAVGHGASRGVSVDAAMSRARFGLVASYGLQRVRFDSGTSSWVPDHGARHLVEGGVIVFPSPTWSVRFGIAGALGRRTTLISGGLEWEASNLLDRGSEFAGSPHYGGSTLGGAALPPYLRADVGIRKTWRVDVGGRQASIALFGTITNSLKRKNVLTYATNPVTGKPVEIDMRPLSPLVLGVDWRY